MPLPARRRPAPGKVTLKAAALLRAVHGIRTPDAIQLATALQDRCTAFVTNDRELPAMDGLAVIQLSDLC